MSDKLTVSKTAKLGIRITSKAQHKLLAEFVNKCGSIKSAAKELGVTSATFGSWLNFRYYPTAHSIKCRPKFYKQLIPKFERLLGVSFHDAFPSIPREALRMLGTRRVESSDVPVERITEAIEREKLSYDGDQQRSLELLELKDTLVKVVDTLSYRESEIIKLRYGLGDGTCYTLEETARIFKVTRERVRQVEAKAIRKLQNPTLSAKLVGY